MPRAVALVLLFALPAVADDPKPFPKPLKDGEKVKTDGWFGKKVLPKRPSKDIRMGDWKDGKQTTWTPHNLVDCIVREDRDGWLLVYDGRREGWVSKDDMVPAEDAPAYFDMVVKADEKNLFARWMRGVGRRERGEYDDAIADFDACLKLDPKDAVALTSRGQAWAGKGELEKAVADYTAALRLDPTSAVAFNNRGCVLADTKKYDDAIRDYDEAVRLDPEYVLPLYNRGNSWGKKGEYQKALADYTAAFKLDPADPYTVAAKAFACGKLKRYADAVKYYEQSLALEPLDWVYRDYARLRAGCPDAKYRDGKMAVKLAKKAVEKAGKDADWEYADALATAYAEAGDFEQAVAEQRKAIEMLKAEKNPDKHDLKQAEARLELYRAKKPYRDEAK